MQATNQRYEVMPECTANRLTPSRKRPRTIYTDSKRKCIVTSVLLPWRCVAAQSGAVAKHKTCYSLFFHPDLVLASQSTGHYHPEIMISAQTLAPQLDRFLRLCSLAGPVFSFFHLKPSVFQTIAVPSDSAVSWRAVCSHCMPSTAGISRRIPSCYRAAGTA